MNWKNFLKPDWKKVLLTIVLAFMTQASFLAPFAFFVYPEEIVDELILTWFSAISFIIALILFFLVSCLFFYSEKRIIQKTDKWKKWIFILPSIVIVLSMLSFIFIGSKLVIETYSIEMTERAKDSQSAFLCNFIIGYRRSQCLRVIGIEQDDPSVCGKIKIQSERNYCYYYAHSCDEIDYLSPEDTFSKDNCYLNRVGLEKDISICDRSWQISDGEERCLVAIAKATVDFSVCEQLGTLKDTCKSEVIIAGKIPDVAVCRELDEVNAKNTCLMSVAQTLDDVTLCEELTNDGTLFRGIRRYRDYCYFYFAVRSLDSKHKGDITLCENIEIGESKREKDDCFKEIATDKRDASLCINVANEQKSASCYRDIAIQKTDYLICDQIQDIDRRDGCYYRVDMTKKAL